MRRLVQTLCGLLLAGATVAGCSGSTDESPSGGATEGTPQQDESRLAAEQVPEPGDVGFLGSRTDLDILAPDGEAPEGTRWEEGTLVVRADDLELKGVWVQAGIDFYGTGTLRIAGSVVEANGASAAVIWGRDPAGHVVVEDSTVTWPNEVPPPSPTWGTGAINGDSRMTIIRSDISGTPDGIQQGTGQLAVSQSYIHDLRTYGEYPNNSHNDGIQLYQGPAVSIKYNNIDLDGYDGVHQNAAIFFAGSEGYSDPEVMGNRLYGGGITLRLESGTSGAVVVDNEFGPLDGAFALVAIEPGATVARWSGNVDHRGNEIAQPSS